jgi:ribosomal protein L4
VLFAAGRPDVLVLLPSVLGAVTALEAFLTAAFRRRRRSAEDALLGAIAAEADRAKRAEDRAERAEEELSRCRRQMERLKAARRARARTASTPGSSPS